MIVADTHAWLWWVSQQDLLSGKARNALAAADAIGVSPISFLEIATAVRRRRIELDLAVRDWIEVAIINSRTIVLSLDIDISVGAGSMEGIIGDPADRIVVATALRHRAPLVTKDHRIRASGLVETIW